jgi:hypothetical protein
VTQEAEADSVSKASRRHSSDEFGRPPSGVTSLSNAWSIFGRRSIGAPSEIAVDALVERESGVTPPPPPFSMRTMVIFLTVVFLVGITGLILLMAFGPQLTRGVGG